MVRANKATNGRGDMRVFLLLGKLITLLFWALVLVSLLIGLAKPFALLLQVVGALVFVAHVLELLLFKARFQNRPNPWLDRLQVMLFGVFHLYGLAPVAVVEVEHA
jgi:putative membrane protein